MRDHDDDRGWVPPEEEMNDRMDHMAEHFNEHCAHLGEIFDRMERIERSQKLSHFLIPIVLIVGFFIFMSGYAMKGVQISEERIQHLEMRR